MIRSARRALVPCALMTIVIMVMIATPARAALRSVSADWPAAKLSRGSTVSVTGRVSGQAADDGVSSSRRSSVAGATSPRSRLDSQRQLPAVHPDLVARPRTYRVVTIALHNNTILGTPSPTWTVEVVPTYTPAGHETQYKYSTSSYARWDPCRTIGYRVNARQATSGAITDVKVAFKRLSQATGFHFVYRGTTTGIPQNGGNSWYPSGTQIVVAWARPAQSSMLRVYAGAEAAGSAVTSGGYANGDGTSVSRIIRGAVVVNSNKVYRGGFGPATPAATSCSTSSATPWAWDTPARASRSCTPGSPAGRPASARATSTHSSAAAPSWAASGKRCSLAGTFGYVGSDPRGR